MLPFFMVIAELKDVGNVKIVIGRKSNKQYLHYCITQKNS